MMLVRRRNVDYERPSAEGRAVRYRRVVELFDVTETQEIVVYRSSHTREHMGMKPDARTRNSPLTTTYSKTVTARISLKFADDTTS